MPPHGPRSPNLKALRRASSALVGWLADRGVPRPLRGLVYGSYCRATGADPREAELDMSDYPSLGAFFVRRLRPGARAIDPAPGLLVAPCDGRLQALGRIERGTLLQAKGSAYGLDELLGGPAAELEDAFTATIYLSPRDYHRVHAPLAATLEEVRWLPGERRSVAPDVLARRARVLATNERAVLALASEVGRAWLVMVGALNVGRIRVVGVEPGRGPAQRLDFARGAELARFEMGSTVVLIVPGARAVAGLAPGDALRLGQRLATFP
ncbi:MAG TPA: archaetidylserine decarboxylase [Planctomycetota bacterium]